MRIAITGASGLVGSRLSAMLRARGDEVLTLVRREPKQAGEIAWDPSSGIPQRSGLEGLDAVVHLAGENIAARRWSPRQKERIRASRVEGTRTLVRELNALEKPPACLISASAIGFYGDRGETPLPESAARGEGFLPEVCEAWEAAAGAFLGRTCSLRFGVILSPEGGALARLLLPFKLGLGGRLGNGRQAFPWVTLRDAVGVVMHSLDSPKLSGPINVVAPQAIDNAEFTRALGRALQRPTLLPMPAFAARLAFGEMAQALLLASTKVVPTRLVEAGYRFADADIDTALQSLLDKDQLDGDQDPAISAPHGSTT